MSDAGIGVPLRGGFQMMMSAAGCRAGGELDGVSVNENARCQKTSSVGMIKLVGKREKTGLP